jgi:hypothetical protein
MISFDAAYIHDDSAFLLFYLDGSNVRRDISNFFKNYNFKIVATQDRVIPYYAPNSSIKHSKSDSKDRSQEIL